MITAKMGNHEVAIISQNCVFAPAHVVRFVTAVSLTKDGDPYIPPGAPTWVRFKNGAGQDQEERGSDFNLAHSAEPWDDAFYGFTYRNFPVEAITKMAVVIPGDKVAVESIHQGKAVEATVSQVVSGRYVVTTFPAQEGDSGSAVRDRNGALVGFVSAIATLPNGYLGSLALVPEIKSLIGTTPVPPPPVTQPAAVTPPVPVPTPTPTPTPTTEAQVAAAYASGKADGYADAVNKARAAINAL